MWHEFSTNLALLAGGRRSAGGRGHVMARQSNPRRLTTGLFWGLYGLLFLLGDWTYQWVGDKRSVNIAVGVAVVALALIAGFGGVRLGSYHQRTQQERTASATRPGNRLFYPALAIPVVTVIGVLLFNNLPSWQVRVFGPGNHATLITLFSMTAGTLIGLMMAIRMTRENVAQPLQEARRLLDSVGWAFILPQILAVLGLLFTSAGVGSSIARLTEHYLAVDSRFVAVAVYTIGMALLTMIMGNAFAAFPDCHGGDWYSDSGASARRESGGDGGDRYVLRLLRDPDDADGGKLQHRAGGAAGIAG